MKKRKNGLFVVFEGAPKTGKTTLSRLLSEKILSLYKDKLVILQRGALSWSDFARTISAKDIKDIGYRNVFYWADIVFDTMDVIIPTLQNKGIIIQDRYDLSIVTYEELHGFMLGEFLLKEYLSRNIIIDPDLTVLLKPNVGVNIERIKTDPQSSAIDMEFLNSPGRIEFIQKRYKEHLDYLGRPYIVLDTGGIACEENIGIILEYLVEEIKEKT